MMRWIPTGTLSTLPLSSWPMPDWCRTLKVASRKFHCYGAGMCVWGAIPATGPYGGGRSQVYSR